MNQCDKCKHYEKINNGTGKCQIHKYVTWWNAICQSFERFVINI